MKWNGNCGKSDLILSFFLYMGFLIILYLSSLDPDPLSKYILCPLSGALSIIFLFKARSGKDHFVTYVFYFIDGLYLCFLFHNKNKEGAFYFVILNLLLVLLFTFITLLKLQRQNLPGSQFTSQFIFLLSKGKDKFLFILSGTVSVLIKFHFYEKWMDNWATSLILQVGLVHIFFFIFHSINENNHIK